MEKLIFRFSEVAYLTAIRGIQVKDLSALSAGTYTLTVIDSSQISFEVFLLSLLRVELKPITPSVNGVFPYFSENLDNVYAGEYVLTATDQNGCFTTTSIQVDQPRTISMDFSNVLF